MDHFSPDKFARTFVLSLMPGEPLLENIERFIKEKGILHGVVLSGIGTLDRCVLHMVMTTGYPPVEHFARWEDKALELASIQGFIADGKPHLHAVVSDNERTWAGHLETGCRVLYLAEVVIAELSGLSLERAPDGKGIKHLRQK